jgi:ribonuclease T2
VPLDKTVRGLFAAALVVVAATPPAFAEGTPGDFDFYVLSLSWLPSYCETADRPDREQCDSGGRGFVVHGLWPQSERGSPTNCAPAQPLPRSLLAATADLMPAGLAQYQWETHGVCSGLRAERYFELVRRALAAVTVPEPYRRTQQEIEPSPAKVEDDFIVANPGLSGRAVAVTCSRSNGVEVRVCLSKRLDFRRCAQVDASYCRQRLITLPAVD